MDNFAASGVSGAPPRQVTLVLGKYASWTKLMAATQPPEISALSRLTFLATAGRKIASGSYYRGPGSCQDNQSTWLQPSLNDN
jgi:hypothetical protein